MEQVFAVTVRHGAIKTTSTNTFSAALTEAAASPGRNDKMLRFMLSEIIECVFYPEFLDREVYGGLLEWFDDWNPIRATQIEVNAIYGNAWKPPTVSVHALFALPVPNEIQCNDWTDLHCSHPSIANAFRFYWTYPWSSTTEESFDERNPDDPRLHRMVADQINFMPITC